MRERNIKTDDHPNNTIQGFKQPKVRQGVANSRQENQFLNIVIRTK